MRRASLRALAKINLTLEVLHKRPDGYHEVRTVLQTVSAPADRLIVSYEPRKQTEIVVEGMPEVPAEANLAWRAAEALLRCGEQSGRVRIEIDKRIPTGAGLGGGSADAAAVLLALPCLMGFKVGFSQLLEIAAQLGSDVPFFLLGGTVAATGRGTELFPLPDGVRGGVSIVAPPVAVSTAQAYQALERPLTGRWGSNTLGSFRSLTAILGAGARSEEWLSLCRNDFEDVVFGDHSELKAIKTQLEREGAQLAQLTGSGSAIYGLWLGKDKPAEIPDQECFRGRLVSRRRYQLLWWKQLQRHAVRGTWPPLSRYAQ